MIRVEPSGDLYLTRLNANSVPTTRIKPGELVEAEVRDWLDGRSDFASMPPPFTPEAKEDHLGPVTGPIHVASAEPGEMLAVSIEAIRIREPVRTAVFRNFGYLADEFAAPYVLESKLDGDEVLFEGKVGIPIRPSLGTISTMPAQGGESGQAGPHGGSMEQNEVRAGARVYLPVFVPGGLLFLAQPRAVVGDGAVCGTGLECSAMVRMRVDVERELRLDRPLIETRTAVMAVGTGATTDDAIRDAVRAMIRYLAQRYELPREKAYALLSAVGDVRLGTCPRPMTAARVRMPKVVLEQL